MGGSSAIDRTASNYNDAKEKVKKIRELMKTGKYDTDVAKYIPGVLEMVYQGMLEDIETKEKAAHSSYKDMEQLHFQIMLTDNYYINPNSIHLCFPMKIKKPPTCFGICINWATGYVFNGCREFILFYI